MFKKTLLTIGVSASLIAYAGVASAHGGATGVVKERMDAMEAMKDSMKTVSDMFKGKTKYDAEQVKQSAKVIQIHSGEALTSLFPEGSLKHPSEAKTEIWKEWDKFSKLAEHLGVLSEGLYLAAGNVTSTEAKGNSSMMGHGHMMGSDHMMGNASMVGGHMIHTAEEYGNMPVEMVFKMLTDNCSSCHTDYRQEKDK